MKGQHGFGLEPAQKEPGTSWSPYPHLEGDKVHIGHLAIKNFRAIADIDCDLSPRMNVIVGPNAVGKTTILQALRLVKGLIAPRSKNEAQQVLVSLSAASPHFPQRIFLKTLARDPSLQTELRSTYVLTDTEINVLKSSIPEFVQILCFIES
jgi:hypothetical protein